MTATVKPPPIIVRMEGVAPLPITMNQAAPIDWNVIVGLPPFQMFAMERGKRNPIDIGNSLQWYLDFARTKINELGEEAFYQQYCDWHTQKGCWPKETPLGQLKG